MKLAHLLTAAPSKMTRTPGAALAAGAVAMCFLLGVGTAQAQTVEQDGDTVTAIRDLVLGDFVYDVEFSRTTAYEIYGSPIDPRADLEFDFDSQEEALTAVDAVNAILIDKGVTTVGQSALVNNTEFLVGFRQHTFRRSRFDVQLAFCLTGDSDVVPGQWVSDFTAVSLPDADVFADFRIVDFTGNVVGINLPPSADANGSYDGVVGEAVVFDGTNSSDPGGTIVSYDWHFGDRTTGRGPTPSKSYAEAGNYAVTLTVTDDNGATDSATTIAIIEPSESGQCEWAVRGRPKWCRRLQESLQVESR